MACEAQLVIFNKKTNALIKDIHCEGGDKCLINLIKEYRNAHHLGSGRDVVGAKLAGVRPAKVTTVFTGACALESSPHTED